MVTPTQLILNLAQVKNWVKRVIFMPVSILSFFLFHFQTFFTGTTRCFLTNHRLGRRLNPHDLTLSLGYARSQIKRFQT